MTAYAYKWTRTGGHPTHGTGQWVANIPREVGGRLVPCKHGIHYCAERHLAFWISTELRYFHDLTPDETIDTNDKLVTRSGVVSDPLPGWNAVTQRLFAADCAAHVLHIARNRRVSACVIVTRAYAHGLASAIQLAAAEAAAAAARYAAARYAAADARDAAARYAAARYAAAYAAASAARYAAAASAAYAAAAAADAAERAWQSRRILAYAMGGIDLDADRERTALALPAALQELGLRDDEAPA